MSTPPLSPADIRAAAEIHAELGPEYRDAVIESFLAKIDQEIAARIDARLPSIPQTQKPGADPVTAARRRGLATGLVSGLAVGTIAAGVPLTLFVIYSAKFDGHLQVLQTGIAVIWAVIAIIYGAAVTAVLLGKRQLNGAQTLVHPTVAIEHTEQGGYLWSRRSDPRRVVQRPIQHD